MSGILDSKSRIIDAVITSQGKRQLADGKFDISYVTFEDAWVAYSPDKQFGHEDPTGKIYFEASSLPQDQVIFEANDDGKLVPFRNQAFYVNSPGGNVSSSFSLGTIKDGKLLVTERHFGRSVTVQDIQENLNDKNKGFIFCDSSGVKGAVLVDPQISAGNFTIDSINNIAYVGTKYGFTGNRFAEVISSSISGLSQLPLGPKVKVASKNNVVFIDSSLSVISNQQQLVYSGTLSSKILLEQSAIGGRISSDEITEANFSSQITGILTSSFDNFTSLKAISTVDRLFVDDQFEISKDQIDFDISKLDKKSIKTFNDAPPNINSLDSIFSDDKLSHLDNFAYLPPIVKVSDNVVSDKTQIQNLSPYLLGSYPSWGDNQKKLDYVGLTSQINEFESSYISFDKTSNKNNVMMQVFEISKDTVSKLDVIDFGELSTRNQDPLGNTRRVFFIGKVFLDNRGTTCFINIFTLMFNKDRREPQ